MANHPVTYDVFEFEYKMETKTQTGTATSVEKVSSFLCRTDFSTFLGLTQFANLTGATTKQIAEYTRRNQYAGGLSYTPKGSDAPTETLKVQGYSRTKNPRATPRGGNVAKVISIAKATVAGSNKKPSHYTGSFNFPTTVTVQEVIIALSMLFSKATGVLASGTGTSASTGKIQPYIYVPKKHPLITNATILTELEAKFGVRVATTVADAQALDSAAAATTTPTTGI